MTSRKHPRLSTQTELEVWVSTHDDPADVGLYYSLEGYLDGALVVRAFGYTGGQAEKAFVSRNLNRLGAILLDRDGYRCSNCRAAGVHLHRHHTLRRSRRRKDVLRYLKLVCVKCHTPDFHNATGVSIAQSTEPPLATAAT